MRPLLLSLLLASPALAQSPAPYGVAKGDRVRLRFSLEQSASSAAVEGRVAAVSADSLTLSLASVGGEARQTVAWQSVGRLETSEENRVGEVVGIVLGLVGGAVVGGLVAEAIDPHSFAYAGGILLGGFGGMPIGAVIGARTKRPWVELPRAGTGGAPVAFRVALPLR